MGKVQVQTHLQPKIETIHFTSTRQSLRRLDCRVDNLIKPKLLFHQLFRSESEGDLLLQQITFNRMFPYFFVAGHQPFIRYITHHLLEMRHLISHIADTSPRGLLKWCEQLTSLVSQLPFGADRMVSRV